MAKLTSTEVYRLARQAGLDPAAAVIATAIAWAESGLDPAAVGDQSLANDTWGPSVGLWQIRSMRNETGLGSARDVDRLTDPAFNAASMVAISGGGTNWNPWSVYKSGAYRQYLGQVGDGEVDTSGWEKGTVTNPSVLDKLNPFDNWASDAMAIGLKLAVVAAAAGLVVLGMARGVGR